MAARALIALGVLLLGLACPRLAAADACLLVEDFANGKTGDFPPDWTPRQESARAVYSILEQDGRRHLHAAARATGTQAGRRHEWDLAAFPVLAWSWRPIEFPKGRTSAIRSATTAPSPCTPCSRTPTGR